MGKVSSLIDDIDGVLDENTVDPRRWSDDPKDRIEHWLGIPLEPREVIPMSKDQMAKITALPGDIANIIDIDPNAGNFSYQSYQSSSKNKVINCVNRYKHGENREHKRFLKYIENFLKHAEESPAELPFDVTSPGLRMAAEAVREVAEQMRLSIPEITRAVNEISNRLNLPQVQPWQLPPVPSQLFDNCRCSLCNSPGGLIGRLDEMGELPPHVPSISEASDGHVWRVRHTVAAGLNMVVTDHAQNQDAEDVGQTFIDEAIARIEDVATFRREMMEDDRVVPGPDDPI